MPDWLGVVSAENVQYLLQTNTVAIDYSIVLKLIDILLLRSCIF